MPAESRTSKSKPAVIKVGSVVVKLYTRTRTVAGEPYPEFRVAWYAADGKRQRKSFTDAKEARQFAEHTAQALNRGDALASTFTGTDATIYADTLLRLKALGVSLLEAVAEYETARKQLPAGATLAQAVADFVRRHPASAPKLSVDQVVTEYQKDREAAGCSLAYLRGLGSRVLAFGRAFQMPIASVEAVAVRNWILGLAKPDGTPLTNRSRLNYVRYVTGLFHFARRQKYVSRELVDEIAEIDVGRAAPTKTGIFTPDELSAMLHACPGDLLPALAIGAFCGLRTAEIARLDWRDVDLARGFVTVGADKAKTQSRRLVPIPDNLRSWLLPHASPAGPINPSTDDRGMNHRLVRGPAKAAGVQWVRNGLRHSFCSYRLAITSDAAKVALEAGNSPQMIFRHYRELVTPAQAATWFAIAPTPAGELLTLPPAVAA
jgi:integrase